MFLDKAATWGPRQYLNKMVMSRPAGGSSLETISTTAGAASVIEDEQQVFPQILVS